MEIALDGSLPTACHPHELEQCAIRLAILSDLHGNHQALEAILDDLVGSGVDQIICLGDIAATGPQPREVLDRLEAIGCQAVQGNMDAWLVGLRSQAPGLEQHPPEVCQIGAWCLEQLEPSHLAHLASLPQSLRVPIDGFGYLLCTHGSPRSQTEAITWALPTSDLEAMLDMAHATHMAVGHTHRPMYRMTERGSVLNPGPAGLPFGGDDRPSRFAQPTQYILLQAEHGHLAVHFRQLPLDVNELMHTARQKGMPCLDWWIRAWTASPTQVTPPSGA